MIKRIDRASPSTVVTESPDQMDIKEFEDAASTITSRIGVTSCGFLGYWQDHLQSICPSPFLASSLNDLQRWRQLYEDKELAIVTFDADVLMTPLYGKMLAGFSGTVIGLTPEMHLRQVIANDSHHLDQTRAGSEITELLEPYLASGDIKALILECTNLPPYKPLLKSMFNVKIYDILTSINTRSPGIVRTEFL